MWTRTLRATLLMLALVLVAPFASAADAPTPSAPANSDTTPVVMALSGPVSMDRVPPLVWILLIGAILVGLRTLRSDR